MRYNTIIQRPRDYLCSDSRDMLVLSRLSLQASVLFLLPFSLLAFEFMPLRLQEGFVNTFERD